MDYNFFTDKFNIKATALIENSIFKMFSYVWRLLDVVSKGEAL